MNRDIFPHIASLIGFDDFDKPVNSYPGLKILKTGLVTKNRSILYLLGAVVSITCMDERERVRYYGSDKTDERGQFDLIVDKVLYGGKNLKPNLCNVRLVSPADQSCGIPTDFGNGQTGEKLVQPFMVFKNLVKFVVGPFYYTTPMCDTPKYENNY